MVEPPLNLFEGVGLELEYMIVDVDTMSVKPCADRLLERAAGAPLREWTRNGTAWCNELALHVVEFKFARPWPRLAGAAEAFAKDVALANEVLADLHACLLPTAMHPWMDPLRETRLWPHEDEEIYRRYDAIFDCRGHGWSNLQSTHINLPFGDDDQFGRLHAAVRAVLPLLPALAASSPYLDGRATGTLDNRLFAYRDNARRLPVVTGLIIPEPVFSIDQYHERILDPIYRAVAPFDPEGVLHGDWLNSRGAIARFERQSIEIRLIDIQECPAADVALCGLVIGVVRALLEERWCDGATQRSLEAAPLARVLLACAETGEATPIADPLLLRTFGQDAPLPARELWLRLFEALAPGDETVAAAGPLMAVYRSHGTLARRMLAAGGEAPDRGLARRLAACLSLGEYLVP